MLLGIPSCLLLVYWYLGTKSKIVYKLHRKTGLPVFFCSCQSADFVLFYEYVIIMFAVTVWKAVAEGMISEEFMKEKGFWEGAQAAMPTALGYISIGLACGIIGSPYVTPVEMGLMSLFVYAGSAQFAMIALITVQAPVAAIAMTVFLINLRLFLLSLHASTYFRHTSLWQNIGMSSLLTDETYGVLMGELVHTDKVNPMWMHGNNLNSYLAWFVGTVVGTALGGLLPNPEVIGLDFALVGMFIGIFTSQFQIMQRRIPLRNLFIILGVVALSFFILLTVVSQSLAVLFATLLGCTMGVVLDGQ